MPIRPYRPGDDDALYDICLRTGDSGRDATPLYGDARLIGAVWVGPYLRLAPEFAFVLDEDGPAGYVLGVPDTVAFERECERSWWPALRAGLPDPGARPVPGEPPPARLARRIHHPVRTPAWITDRYPAHLHIDLLPWTQRRGHGRRLLDVLFAALAGAGAPAVHLGVGAANTGALAFYRAAGFTELERFPDAVLMGRALP